MSVSAAPSNVPSMAPTMSLVAIENEGMRVLRWLLCCLVSSLLKVSSTLTAADIDIDVDIDIDIDIDDRRV